MENKSQARQCQPLSSSKSSTPVRKPEFSAKGNGRRRGKDNGSPSRRSAESSQVPQKWNKGPIDKRPRPRGYYGNRQREEVAEAEGVPDVFRSNSRKGNANELLQFHFRPRESENHPQGRSGYRGSSGGHGRPRKTMRYNKERFLQASCQFVVRENGEYTQQAIDPDSLVNWDSIELVRIFSTESVKCPICLNVPFAGKITKCGHIYCWACMIHYLTLGEKDYRKCPICYDSVKVEDLRSVQWVEVPDYKVGDTIEMQLMQKSKGCVYVSPKPDWTDRKGLPHNFKDGENTKYAKLLLATKEQIQTEVIDLEKTALEIQLSDGDEEEMPYISMAQELLTNREQALHLVMGTKNSEDKKADQILENPSDLQSELASPNHIEQEVSELSTESFEDDPRLSSLDASDIIFALEGHESDDAESHSDEVVALPQEIKEPKERRRMDSEGSIPFGSPVNPFPLEDQPITPQSLSPEELHDNLELPHDAARAPPQARRVQRPVNKETYYFYQAGSGQHMYLHSVNARCFQEQYGSLENCPQTISANIVAIKRMFMTEDVRKRLRYLNHIPLTCEFHVVELNLRPPLVSKETLKTFRGDLERLRRERQREAREDKIRARQVELEHREAHGLYEDMSINLGNTHQFPSSLSSPPQEYQDVQRQVSIDSEEGQGAIPGWGSSQDAGSFAKIAASGSGAWSSAPSAPRWRPLLAGSQSMHTIKPSGDGSEGEELAAPSYTASMYAAMDNLDISLANYLAEKEKESSTPDTAASGKKKKKKKMQPLFSTAMARKN